jgi:hypothetical protein
MEGGQSPGHYEVPSTSAGKFYEVSLQHSET